MLLLSVFFENTTCCFVNKSLLLYLNPRAFGGFYVSECVKKTEKKKMKCSGVKSISLTSNNGPTKPKRNEKKHKCTCWCKAKGCKCLSRGYPSACICCKFHNKKMPRPFPLDKVEAVWIQTPYPNRFVFRGVVIMPVVPDEASRDWQKSGAVRTNGQEILCAYAKYYN